MKLHSDEELEEAENGYYLDLFLTFEQMADFELLAKEQNKTTEEMATFYLEYILKFAHREAQKIRQKMRPDSPYRYVYVREIGKRKL